MIAGLFLQLARAFGARQIIVVGRRASIIEEVARPGATHTVNSKAVDVVDEVMRFTDNKGVDVALICAPSERL